MTTAIINMDNQGSGIMGYSIYFTAKDGETAKISGDLAAIQAIEEIFKQAGIRFDETVETWDAGYYDSDITGVTIR